MQSSGSRRAMLAFLASVCLAACTTGNGAAVPDSMAASSGVNDTTPNTLTDAERRDGWRLLFDGRTTSGWRGFRKDVVPDAWSVVDGTLTFDGSGGGDIVTVDQFGDFELVVDWRVGPGGNSGIFYRVTEDVDAIYHSGPEYQVLDDAGHADGQSPLTSAGAAYGLYPAPRGAVRPAGEWNHARIVVREGHVEHWLNGVQTASYQLGSEDWERRVRESKFVEWPAYGRAARGHIGLQDHGDPVSFRNIKIRELR